MDIMQFSGVVTTRIRVKGRVLPVFSIEKYKLMQLVDKTSGTSPQRVATTSQIHKQMHRTPTRLLAMVSVAGKNN